MLLAFTRFGGCLWLLATVACGPTRPAQFRDGAKLYDRETHQYFGKVVGYQADHDFHNGFAPQPAILIDKGEGQGDPTWGACSTCAAVLEARP